MSNYDINWEEYFKPDNWWKLNDSSGPAIDSIAGRDGILSGSPTVNVLGKVNTCYTFVAASSQYVDIGNIFASRKSISFWIKADSTTEEIIALSGATRSVEVSAGTITATGLTSPIIYVDGILSSTLPDTKWHFILITSATEFVVDDMDIGRVVATYLDGSIDDVRLYNKVLSPVEIKQLYDYTNNYRDQSVPIIHKLTHDKYTKLYCTFDGDLHDESESRNVLNPIGNTISLDNESKFGSYSFKSITPRGNRSGLAWYSHSILSFGTDDFTVDFWTKLSSIDTDRHVFINGGILDFLIRTTGTPYNGINVYLGATNIITDVEGAVTLNDGAWHHIAVCRGQGDIYLFVDGNLIHSEANSTNIQVSDSVPITIGQATSTHTINQPMQGWMSDLRISKGIARWTSDFMPEKLLLHFEADFNDSSNFRHVITDSNVLLDTIKKKFGSYSAKFNGSTSQLTIPAHTVFGFGSGDFTIDFWFLVTSYSNIPYFIDIGIPNGTVAFITSSGYLGVYIDSQVHNGDTQIVMGQWHHYAFVRSGSGTNNCKLYLDGQKVAEFTETAVINDGTTSDTKLGTYNGSANWLNGQIDELRVVKGRAIWIANFTPPTSAYILRDSMPYKPVKYINLSINKEELVDDAGDPVSALGYYCQKNYPSLLLKDQIKAISQNRFSGAILPEKPRAVNPDEAIIITPGDF